jgi:hypothetical protein
MEFENDRLANDMENERGDILNGRLLEKRLKVLPFVMRLRHDVDEKFVESMFGRCCSDVCGSGIHKDGLFDEEVQRMIRENSFNEFVSIDTNAMGVNESTQENNVKNYSLSLHTKRTLNAKTVKRYMLDGFKMSLFSTPLTEEAFASSITTNPLYSKLNVIEDYLKCYRTYVFERM